MRLKRPHFLAVLVRPATLLRVFWGGVALLHVIIFATKLISGRAETILDQGRLALLLFAAVYGGVMGWRAAGRIQISAKKFWAFALAVIFGHCAVTSSQYGELTRQAMADIEWTRVAAVAPSVVLTLGVLLGAALARSSASQDYFPDHLRHPGFSGHIRAHRSHAPLYQRPPPSR